MLFQWFPNFFGLRTTQKIWWSAKDKILNYIGIRGPLQLISRTTSGPRSRLWESLIQGLSINDEAQIWTFFYLPPKSSHYLVMKLQFCHQKALITLDALLPKAVTSFIYFPLCKQNYSFSLDNLVECKRRSRNVTPMKIPARNATPSRSSRKSSLATPRATPASRKRGGDLVKVQSFHLS